MQLRPAVRTVARPAPPLPRPRHHVQVLAGQLVAARAVRPVATVAGTWAAALAFLVFDVPSDTARLALARAIRCHVQVLAAVEVPARAVRLERLVMRDRAASLCLHSPVLPALVDPASPAAPVPVLVTIGVRRRELVAVEAVGGPRKDRRTALARQDVRLRHNRAEMGRVHAAAMQASRTASTALAAVVALVVHLQVTWFAALRRQRRHQDVVGPAVHRLGGPVAHRELAVPLRIDAASPTPAPVSAAPDLRPETQRQALVTEYCHRFNAISPGQDGWR